MDLVSAKGNQVDSFRAMDVLIEEMGPGGKTFAFDDAECKEIKNKKMKTSANSEDDDCGEMPTLEKADTEYEGLNYAIQDKPDELDRGFYIEKCRWARCVYCHGLYENEAKLLCHPTCFYLRRGVEAINVNMQPFQGKKFPIACDYCGKPFESLIRLQKHFLCHFHPNYFCKVCGHGTKLCHNLQTHIQQRHGK